MIFGPAFDAGKSEFFSLFRLGKRENEWDLLNLVSRPPNHSFFRMMKYWLFIAALMVCLPYSVSTEITTSRNMRYLLWHSPSPEFSSQFERTWQPEAVACKDRDLVLVQITNDADRKAYKIPKDATAILLIGKDGGVKARWSEQVIPKKVYDLIDAMPMRQQEIQRKSS